MKTLPIGWQRLNLGKMRGASQLILQRFGGKSRMIYFKFTKKIVQGLGEKKSPPAEDPNRWCILDTLPKVLSTMWTPCMREPHWGHLLLQFMLCLIFWPCVYAKSPLRGCKFSLERSKEKLDFHFTVEALGKLTNRDLLRFFKQKPGARKSSLMVWSVGPKTG